MFDLLRSYQLMIAKDDLYHLVDELDDAAAQTALVLLQAPRTTARTARAEVDAEYERAFYGFCTWRAVHPDWRPTSAAHPSSDDHPFSIDPKCPGCGTLEKREA